MRAAAAAFFVLGTLFSGCTTGPGDGSDVQVVYDNRSTVILEEDGQNIEVPITNDTGTVVGYVLSEAGFGLPEARVTVSGANLGATTNKTGWFQVTQVKPGKSVVRAEREYYLAAQSEILVEAGKVVRLSIAMIPVNDNAGYNPHLHDHWAGKEAYTIFDAEVKLNDNVNQVPPDVCVAEKSFLRHLCDWELPFPLEPGIIVPPGTKNITIDVDFVPGPLFARERWSLEVHPPQYVWNSSRGEYVERYGETFYIQHPGDRFEIDLSATPELVDDGHAKSSAWSFTLRMIPGTSGSVISIVDVSVGGAWYEYAFRKPVHVVVTAHKGELVADPPHPRFWKDSDAVSMPTGQPGSAVCLTGIAYQDVSAPHSATYYCDSRSPNPYVRSGKIRECYGGCMVLDSGALVPPGTTRIEFDLEHWWSNATAEAARGPLPPDEFVLGYKNASLHLRHNYADGLATWNDYTWIDPVRTYTPDPVAGRHWATGRHYVIQDVPPEATDLFYARLSNWVFMLAVKGHEEAETWKNLQCSYAICGIPYFELKNFTVINENRAEMLLSGQV